MRTKITTLLLSATLLVLCGKNAISQITTYAVDQTITSSSGAFTLDVNNDGFNDYTFEILPLGNDLVAARVVTQGNSKVMDSSTFGYPDALNLGDSIMAPYSSGNAVLGTAVGGAGLFTGAGLKYLGLNISSSADNYLGWLSLEVTSGNDTIVLHDIGYNTSSNDSITAGQESLVSVNEINSIELDIYPNPCSHVLNVEWPYKFNNTSYSITDLNGKLILSGALTASLDVSALALGTYIIVISDGTATARKRFTRM
ncbi:MAG: T9SS type A sorting domain-containing protein [Flavobacteriales bacterium]